jgi:hypothetical protein
MYASHLLSALFIPGSTKWISNKFTNEGLSLKTMDFVCFYRYHGRHIFPGSVPDEVIIAVTEMSTGNFLVRKARPPRKAEPIV